MSTSNEQSDAEESARVLAVTKALSEHFDAVVVLCSRHEGSRGTRTIAKGSGNWHTQFGIVREWIITQEERVKREARDEATS